MKSTPAFRAGAIALIALCLLGLSLFAGCAQAQQQDTARLEPVLVTVTRGSGTSVLGSPFALTVLRPDSMRPGLRHAGLDESLALVPGLSTTSRNNPSQDPRLSIRGFGARSAFGVRGIRVLRDGMPLTLPDGQTPLDYLSLESVGRIEIMRGSASALYGNSSGGIVDIRTREPASAPIDGELRHWTGGDTYSRSAIAMSGSAGSVGWVADAAHTRGDGSRDHSRQRSTSGFARATHRAASTQYGLTVMALDNPLSENPGALTLGEMRANAGAADPASVRRNARKSVTQVQVGASAEHTVADGELVFSAFGGARSLDNPLAFAVVEIGRHSWGASTAFRRQFAGSRQTHRLAAGLDLQLQNDLRRNYVACADTIAATAPTASCPVAGSGRGAVTLDQREIVSGIGAYLSDEVDITARVSATAGIRADAVRFEVRDRLISAGNPDDSGKRTLRSVSPVVGLLARASHLISLYANVSSAFETPTATEMGNQPDGSAGINPDLEPQRSLTAEGGSKGFIGRFVSYDIALFRTAVRDELIPFEIPASDGRRYFRNAGRTSRLGAEAGVFVVRGSLSLMGSYSLSRFRFEDFVTGGIDFSNNEIPGVPRHRGQAAATMAAGLWFGVVEGEFAGSSFADDANSFRAPGYSVFHVRGGLSPQRRNGRIRLILAVQNLFDRTYAPSIAVNAARERYFEPAPGRVFSAGVSIGATAGSRSEVPMR